jgi:tRNA 2-thiocytidine biosynthesis protein TtcA
MGFKSDAWSMLDNFCRSRSLPLYMEETDYGLIAHDRRNRGKSPCFVCSLNRRKRLFELASLFGCNKIALGHNLDDVIETFFINVLFAGEISTMRPLQQMFEGELTIIRPLAFVEKGKIDKLARKLHLPVTGNPCPSSGQSKRSEIREWIEHLASEHPEIRGNVRRALGKVKIEYLL